MKASKEKCEGDNKSSLFSSKVIEFGVVLYTKTKVHCLYLSVLRGRGDKSDKVYDWNSTVDRQ